MTQCDIWGCRLDAVERLEMFNTWSGPYGGYLDICALHLIDHIWEHFMIHRITYDEQDNVYLEMDEAGIDYMLVGLNQLLEDGPGGLRSTPSVWAKSAPWWRFWNRGEDPVIGDFFLRFVEEEASIDEPHPAP